MNREYVADKKIKINIKRYEYWAQDAKDLLEDLINNIIDELENNQIIYFNNYYSYDDYINDDMNYSILRVDDRYIINYI